MPQCLRFQTPYPCVEVMNGFGQFIDGAFHVLTDIFQGVRIACLPRILFSLDRAHKSLAPRQPAVEHRG